MPFDVEAARKSGYSDDEILKHLTTSRKFDVDGARKAGYSSQEIIGHLSGAPSVLSGPYSGGPKFPEDAVSGLAKAGIHALPAIGATAAAIFQPELIPAAAGFWATTAAATGAAAVGGGIGSAAEQGLESAFGMKDRPKSGGEFAKRLGIETAEQAGYEAGGRLIAKPFSFLMQKFAPERLLGSAIKPSTTLDPAKRSRVLNTMARENITASRGGYEKLVTSINSLTKEIDSQIAAKSPNLGAVIKPDVVSARLDALIDFYEKQAKPAEDIAAIKNVREQFLSRHSHEAPFTAVAPYPSKGPGQPGGFVTTGHGSTRVFDDMTLGEAQAVKRGTQRFNAPKFGARGGAGDEAEKALAFSLREQIEHIFPEIKALNARDSEMLELKKELRRYVGREQNKNVVGLIPAVLAASAGAVGGGAVGSKEGPGAGLTSGGILALSVLALDNPQIKSRLAIAIWRAAQKRLLREGSVRLGKEIPAIGMRTAGGLLGINSPSQ